MVDLSASLETEVCLLLAGKPRPRVTKVGRHASWAPRVTEAGRHESWEPRVTEAGHLSGAEEPLCAGEDNLLLARRGHLEDGDCCRQTVDFQIAAAPTEAVSSRLTSDLVTSGQKHGDRDLEEAGHADHQTSSRLVHFYQARCQLTSDPGSGDRTSDLHLDAASVEAPWWPRGHFEV